MAELSVGETERLGGRGNLWAAFVIASLGLLEENGELGFVLPAAYTYADYAAPLRSLVERRFRTVTVYRSQTPLFPNVSEGSVVLLAKGYRHNDGESNVTCIEVPDLGTVIERLEARAQLVGPLPPPPLSTCEESRVHFGRLQGTRLADYLSIRIGAVTGDGRYFLLSEGRRSDLDLPDHACVPIVSRNRHLAGGQLDEARWQSLRNAGERVWLFRPPDELLAHPAVASYLALPEGEGGCRRGYKVSGRDPWHRTPLPERADLFVSGMAGRGPLFTVNVKPDLQATNTLYVARFKAHVSEADRVRLSTVLTDDLLRDRFAAEGRRYPDGLVKFEPSDLLRLPLP